MLFEEFTYQRPDIDSFTEKFQNYLVEFEKASDFESHESAFMRLNELRMEFMSMYNICHIRHTMDTNDKFYEEENAFFDTQMPQYENLTSQFYQSLIHSGFKERLKEKMGATIVRSCRTAVKDFQA